MHDAIAWLALVMGVHCLSINAKSGSATFTSSIVTISPHLVLKHIMIFARGFPDASARKSIATSKIRTSCWDNLYKLHVSKLKNSVQPELACFRVCKLQPKAPKL